MWNVPPEGWRRTRADTTLALMRSGEHDVARAYVLYRAKHMEERRAAKEAQGGAAAIAAPQINVLENGVRKPLEMSRVTGLINAAVEAARAGEQGRGFAVVATEVRNLAHRSSAAAKEIKELIAASVANVDTGSRLVNEAGQTMGDIVDSIVRVTDIMGEITSATHEQTIGIEQINMAIAQMDEVTQQNAALVEEAAAASQSMQEQAGAGAGLAAGGAILVAAGVARAGLSLLTLAT